MARAAYLAVIAAVLACLAGTQAASVALNKNNFEDQVFGSGKSAFIKFQAPW